MPRFFIDASPIGEQIEITGADARHISRVLRMQSGEALTICDAAGTEYTCVLTQAQEHSVTARIISCAKAQSEPSIFTTLYMALPKADKMETIVQKCTELGICQIVPYIAARCVSRPEPRALQKKQERWQKIAAEAAKQCGRGRIPVVEAALTMEQAVRQAAQAPLALLLYEAEREASLQAVLRAHTPLTQISFMVGPEGGFEEKEALLATQAGMQRVSLGKRILRCETAPIAALTVLQYESGNL